jgi:hypothetical protein
MFVTLIIVLSCFAVLLVGVTIYANIADRIEKDKHAVNKLEIPYTRPKKKSGFLAAVTNPIKSFKNSFFGGVYTGSGVAGSLGPTGIVGTKGYLGTTGIYGITGTYGVTGTPNSADGSTGMDDPRGYSGAPRGITGMDDTRGYSGAPKNVCVQIQETSEPQHHYHDIKVDDLWK